jgi:tetratricopeptide (TPR) repeat protein
MLDRTSLVLLLAGIATLGATACSDGEAKANNQGNDAFEQQEYDDALDAYEKAKSRSSELAEPHYNSGNVYYRQEAYEDAAASYDRAMIDADPKLAQDGIFNLGNALFQSDEVESAIDSYKEALRIDPGDQDAKHNLELALRRLEQVEQEQARQQPGQQSEDENEGERQQQDPQTGDQQPEQEGGEEEGGDGQDQEDSPGDDPQQEEQPRQVETTELTEEQARQLLTTIGEETETLQDRLQRTIVIPGRPPDQDW